MQNGVFQFDHVVIAGVSLEETMNRYVGRGFFVHPGGFETVLPADEAHMRFPNRTGIQFIRVHTGRRYKWKRKRSYRQFRKSANSDGSVCYTTRTYRYFDRGPQGYKGYAFFAPATEEVRAHLSDCGYLCAGTTRYHHLDGTSVSFETYVDAASLALPVVYLGEQPQGEQQANASTGVFRVEIGAQRPSEIVQKIETLTGESLLDARSADVPRPTVRVGDVNLEISSVDTGLEEGVLETGLRAGFPGHNVLYDPDRNDSAAVHVSYRPGSAEESESAL